MAIACKIFPNAKAARGAMNAVKAAWTRPTLTRIRCTKPALLAMTNAGLVLCTDAVELTDGRWAIIAEHAAWKTDTIDESLIKRPATTLPTQAAPKGGK